MKPMASAVKASAQQVQELLSERVTLLEQVVDNFPGGILLFDRNLEMVLCNDRQRQMLDYPDELFASGNPTLERIFRFNAERGEYGPGDVEELVRERMERVARREAHVFERTRPNGTILEVRGMPLADGGFVTTYLDVTEQRKNAALIAHLAHHDMLTGLANRTLLMDRLQMALASSRRGRRMALHYLDLDKFKPINDRYGHAMGDDVLKRVAEAMRKTVRETDTVARLGGDEFVVIQSDVDASGDAAKLAQRLLSVVGERHFANNADVTVGVSIGIAFAPEDGDTPHGLLHKADTALYTAKREGGNRMQFHSVPAALRDGLTQAWQQQIVWDRDIY
jgi:diguanylate cyclase (GGDEF)-like protein